MHNAPFIVSKSRGTAVYRAAIYGALGLLGLSLTACGGGGGGGDTATVSYTVSSSASTGGSISPASVTVNDGATTGFTVSADTGYSIASVTGCGGSLAGNIYTTGAVTADCTVTASFVLLPPVLSLTPTAVKSFHFSWVDVEGETGYRLLENPDGVSGYTEVAATAADVTSHDLEVFLPGRVNASYMLQVCDAGGCTDHAEVAVSGTLAAAVGYVKASNTQADDGFGLRFAFSADGNALAVGAWGEDSNATGIDGDKDDNTASNSGAVYLFNRSAGIWSQQAYIKASNSEAGDIFGIAVALSADGDTLAVGASSEDSATTGTCAPADTGCDISQADNSAGGSGAVYVYIRSAGIWSHQAYIKASNSEASDYFGSVVALSGDGNTLAVGASSEDSATTGTCAPADTGCDTSQADNSVDGSGAVYLFTRSGVAWSQQAYIKASNTGAGDRFGREVTLSADGNTLAVGADQEDSNATGIGGNETDNSAGNSGAVYLYTRSGAVWSQQAYVKASNTGAGDQFGDALTLSNDGNTLAVGANQEDSAATGIDGNQADNTVGGSGAVYLFTRSIDGLWSQQAYIKASNSEVSDLFGSAVTLSGNGNILAVGAYNEDGAATGIGGDQADNMSNLSGAVYLFTRSAGFWSQQAYIKAPNSGEDDRFGSEVTLSADGNTLAVGAEGEGSSATGIGGDQADNTAYYGGAVYLY